MPQRQERRRPDLPEYLHPTVRASPRDALLPVWAYEGGYGDGGDWGIRRTTAFGRKNPYLHIPLIPISPFMGPRQRYGHSGEHTELPKPPWLARPVHERPQVAQTPTQEEPGMS